MKKIIVILVLLSVISITGLQAQTYTYGFEKNEVPSFPPGYIGGVETRVCVLNMNPSDYVSKQEVLDPVHSWTIPNSGNFVGIAEEGAKLFVGAYNEMPLGGSSGLIAYYPLDYFSLYLCTWTAMDLEITFLDVYGDAIHTINLSKDGGKLTNYFVEYNSDNYFYMVNIMASNSDFPGVLLFSIDDVTLNAVPEPGSFVALAAGISGLGLVGRRRKS